MDELVGTGPFGVFLPIPTSTAAVSLSLVLLCFRVYVSSSASMHPPVPFALHILICSRCMFTFFMSILKFYGFIG